MSLGGGQQAGVVSFQDFDGADRLFEGADGAPGLAAVARPAVAGGRKPDRTANGGEDAQFRRFQDDGRIGPVRTAHEGQRAVAAALLLDDDVAGQIPLQFDAQILQSAQGQIQRGDLPFAVAGAPAEEYAIFDPRRKRIFLAGRGRNHVDMRVDDQGAPTAAAFFRKAQIGLVGIGEIVQGEGVVRILLDGVGHEDRFAGIGHLPHPLLQKTHGRSLLAADGRKADQIGKQFYSCVPARLDGGFELLCIEFHWYFLPD